MEKKKYYIVYQITNKINDYVYIGVHITENINDKYFGSGTDIKKAIKKFGKENFKKIILYNFDIKEEMLGKERELVNDEFIMRGDTYNIVLGGGDINTENFVVVKDKNDNNFMVHKTDPRYLSGELVGCSKGNVVVKDKDSNILQISLNDPRYLSGELVSIMKGMLSVKDKNGNTLQVSINDPRYLSGELVHVWQGKTHNIESRKKMSIAKKGKGIGKENSQFGTSWVYNEKLEKNKKIKKEELTTWIEKGWLKGYRKKYF